MATEGNVLPANGRSVTPPTQSFIGQKGVGEAGKVLGVGEEDSVGQLKAKGSPAKDKIVEGPKCNDPWVVMEARGEIGVLREKAGHQRDLE